MECLAAGFLVKETETYYMVCQLVGEQSESPHIRDHPWHSPQAIPKVAVTNFRVLEAANGDGSA